MRCVNPSFRMIYIVGFLITISLGRPVQTHWLSSPVLASNLARLTCTPLGKFRAQSHFYSSWKGRILLPDVSCNQVQDRRSRAGTTNLPRPKAASDRGWCGSYCYQGRSYLCFDLLSSPSSSDGCIKPSRFVWT